MSSLIAIVGRPNVGKSRLFNRLSRTQKAIVHDHEGVTRDRQYERGEWYGKEFTLIDTGGFVPDSDEPMLEQMRLQAQLAIDQADVIIFMMDSKSGLVTGDRDILKMLRQTEKPVYYAVNKVDSWPKREEAIWDFYELGVDLFPISAEHGNGIDNLMDALAEDLEATSEEIDEDSTKIHIAVVGKPNAGKSSLVNAMIGENRLLTSDVPGTTRDSIDMTFTRDDREYVIIDTAGLRRKSRVTWQLEQYAVVQAIRSLDRAEVALFVVDATEGITDQDKKIASVLLGRGCACVVVVNKWDLVEKDSSTAGEYVKEIHYQMPFMRMFPVIFTSALTGQRVHKLLDMVEKVFEQYTQRIPTAALNTWLEGILQKNTPPIYRNRPLKIFYMSQVATRPPAFTFIVNYPDGVAPNFRKFLENQLREAYGFEGTPIRTMIRKRRQGGD